MIFEVLLRISALGTQASGQQKVRFPCNSSNALWLIRIDWLDWSACSSEILNGIVNRTGLTCVANNLNNENSIYMYIIYIYIYVYMYIYT